MIKNAIITAAGLGTRLLPTTKELPKEMLPIFLKHKGQIILKPMLQAIFDQLYDFGIRGFYFVVGRGKRSIEDHFTPDYGFIEMLKHNGKNEQALILEEFYKKLENSTLVFINQPNPIGFGDAVLRVKSLINDDFIVHAGDTYIISNKNEHLNKMVDAYFKHKADACLLLQEVEKPRIYGVAEVEELTSGIYKVKSLIEKPEEPPSNMAIMPIYIFKSSIFEALKATKPGIGNEIQLTDGIQKLIDWGFNVIAVKLSENETRLDIGTVKTYYEVLELSKRYLEF